MFLIFAVTFLFFFEEGRFALMNLGNWYQYKGEQWKDKCSVYLSSSINQRPKMKVIIFLNVCLLKPIFRCFKCGHLNLWELEFDAYFESENRTGPYPNTWNNWFVRFFSAKSVSTSGDRAVLIHVMPFSLAGKAVRISVPAAQICCRSGVTTWAAGMLR